MRNIQNDFMKIQAQNAFLAQEVAEANKSRHAERARSETAEELLELQKAEEMKDKAVRAVSAEGNANKKDQSKDLRLQRYNKDGTLEEDSGPAGIPPPKRIDIKI